MIALIVEEDLLESELNPREIKSSCILEQILLLIILLVVGTLGWVLGHLNSFRKALVIILAGCECHWIDSISSVASQ